MPLIIRTLNSCIRNIYFRGEHFWYPYSTMLYSHGCKGQCFSINFHVTGWNFVCDLVSPRGWFIDLNFKKCPVWGELREGSIFHKAVHEFGHAKILLLHDVSMQCNSVIHWNNITQFPSLLSQTAFFRSEIWPCWHIYSGQWGWYLRDCNFQKKSVSDCLFS